MIIASFVVLSLICVWAIIRPLMVEGVEASFQDGLSEVQHSESQDLRRFLEAIEFEHARGLIGENEFVKQKTKVEQRLAKLADLRS